MNVPVRALGMALALALAACSSLPVGSVLPLMRLDLATTRVEQLRVGLQLVEGLQPQEGGVTLDAVLRLAGQPDEQQSFLLVRSEGAGDLAGLVPLQREGERIFVFQLAGNDIARFKAIQDAIAAARAKKTVGSLSFGIATREFCRTGTDLPARALASTYLRTPETNGWLTVSDQLDLRSEPEIAKALPTLAPCAAS